MGFTKAGVHSEHLAVLTLEQSSDEYSSDEDGNVQVGLRQQARFRQQRIVCHRLSVSQIKCRIGKRWLKRSENLQELCQGDVEGFELKAYETNGSRFQRLFEDPQALKIWEHFTDLSEEEQKKILEAADQYNKRSKHNACSITVGQNIPHLQHFIKTVPLTRQEKGLDFYKLLPDERNFEQKMTLMFRSTYTCESVFSTIKLIKNYNRNCLTDSSVLHLLRLPTAQLDADIPASVAPADQLQFSH